MTTFYVATLARYVLVDAANEVEARQRGYHALYTAYADDRQRLDRPISIRIRSVRPATDDEIRFVRWHDEMLAHEIDLTTCTTKPRTGASLF